MRLKSACAVPDRISCSARTTAEVIDVLNFTPRRSNALKKFETTPRWRKWVLPSAASGREERCILAKLPLHEQCSSAVYGKPEVTDGEKEGGSAINAGQRRPRSLSCACAVDAGGMNKGRLFLSSLFIHPRIMNHEVEFRAGKEERA